MFTILIFLALSLRTTHAYCRSPAIKLCRYNYNINHQRSQTHLFLQPTIPNVPITNNSTFEPYVNPQSSNSDNDSNKSNEALMKNLTIGFAQLRPFLNIAVPFFQQDVNARNGLLGVGGLTLLNSGVSVAFSYISRDFYNALNTRDETLFYEKIEYFFIALLVAVPISVYYQFLRQKLSLYWREALTEKILNLYLNNKKYYEMELLRDIDNPDQRIGDDIRFFTRTSLDFFITLITSIIDLFSFSAILFQIYPGLFFAIIGYAGVGTLVTTNLGRSLVSLNYEKLQREATFRFSLIRLRENSESIAFYDADAKSEKIKLWELFINIVNNQNDIINVKRNIESFTTAYRYLVQILPSLIVAPLYFQKKVELGSISQSYGAFNHILGDFSIIINQFESISSFSAGITRLTFFLDRLENIPLSKPQYTQVSADNQISYNPEFQLGHISFCYEQQKNPRQQADVVSDNKTSSSSDTATTAGVYNGLLPVGTVGSADATTHNNVDNTRPILHYQQQQQYSSPSSLVFKCENVTVLTPDRSRVVIGAIPSSSSSLSSLRSSDSSAGAVKSSSTASVSTAKSSIDETTNTVDVDNHDNNNNNNNDVMIYSGVNLAVYEGQRVLIVGPSGCGKSSFLRAVAGLWTSGLGTVTWYDDASASSSSTINSTSTVGVAVGVGATNVSEDVASPKSNNNASRGSSMTSLTSGSTPSNVLFLPQKPYNVLGTLKEQIMYPASNEKNKLFNSTHLTDGTDFSLIGSSSSSGEIYISDDEEVDDEYFLHILRQVKLERLAYRIGNGNEHDGLCNIITDWGKVLSLGEQQRLAFARVLYSQPSVVFLDEATSALDLVAEESMYQLLSKMKVTFLSVGHRPSLLKYHDVKLLLPGPGRQIQLVNINHHDGNHTHDKDRDEEEDDMSYSYDGDGTEVHSSSSSESSHVS